VFDADEILLAQLNFKIQTSTLFAVMRSHQNL
jgi:hypothetical protein